MDSNRLRNCIDHNIVKFSLDNLLGCSLIEEPLFFDEGLRFDNRKQVVWRASDYEAYRIIYPINKYVGHRILTTTKFLFTGDKTGLFIRPKYEIKGLVIFPRDSVIVTVAKSLGVAIKVLRKNANQKNVIKNECKAYKLLPEFVPAVLNYQDSCQLESFDFVISQFVANSSPVKHEEWQYILPTVMQALLLSYERGGFKRIKVTEVIEQARNTLEINREQTEFFYLCQNVIQDLSEICMRYRDAKLMTAFVHGDVTCDAIHRNGNSIKIIDWGNAGFRSVFYDLFIQEFYRADSKFWRNILQAESNEFFSDYFFGIFDSFYKEISTLTCTNFSLADIKGNLVVSLLQNAIDNFERYRTIDELEGIEFFQHINKIKNYICVVY